MKRITCILTVLHMLVFSSLMLGCSSPAPEPADDERTDSKARVISPAPVPVNATSYAQITAQASEHWRDMAVYTASRVYKAYEDRSDLLERPIFIAQPNNRPFTVAFYHLLRTELVSRGLQVSNNKEPNSVILEYSVQTVPFDPSRFDNAKRYDGEGTASDHEVIVNSRLFYRNRFVMHCSSIRYINDGDLPLYVDPQVADPMAESTRSIRITGK